MSSIEFSKSLEPLQLAEWLNQTLKKDNAELKQEQQTNLLSEEINGTAFVLLSEVDLKDLGFTLGQRKIILQIIKELNEKTVSLPDSEEPPTLCSTDLMIPAGTSNASGTSGLAAWAPGDKIWKGRSTLKVRFMQNVPVDWKIDGRSVTHRTILQRANTWNDMEPSIPKFIEADSLDDSDIRVKFYTIDEESGDRVYGQTWSALGTDADAAKSKEKATMYLDLSHQDDNYKKHVIVHEFGHTLGLGHEHQRSKFWDIANRYIQTTKMFDSIKRMNPGATLTYEQFRTQWGVDKTPGSGTEFYDPDSVMHYWFDVNWLDDHYSQYKDPTVFENDPTLSEVAKKILRGIHKRPGDLPIVPSKDDISFLRDKYQPAGNSKGKDPLSAPPPQTDQSMSWEPSIAHSIPPPTTSDYVSPGSSVTSAQNVPLSIPSQQLYVKESDWATISMYFQQLGKKRLKRLGGKLGLVSSNFDFSDDLPGDIATAWLRRDNQVIEKCGRVLTWNILVEKLRDPEVDGGGIADNILREVFKLA